MKYVRIARLAGVVAAGSGVSIAAIGCGGGSRSGSSAATSPVSGNAAALRVAVKWPQQRAASGAHLIPDDAGSILLQLATPSGTTVASTCLVRPTSTGTPSSYTFTNVPSGALVLTASAFSDEACSQTPAQAIGTTSVTVQAGGSRNVAVTMAGTVASISVSTSSPTVVIGGGSSTTLTATALDSQSETVLTAPGDWTWRCTPATGVSPASGTGPTATITGAALGTVSCTFSLTQAAGAPAITATPAAITVQPLPPPASQYTLTSLASFSGNNGVNPNCLVSDGHGGYYGTTGNGGAAYNGNPGSGNGTLFKWTPSGGVTTLVNFDGANNGQDPSSLTPDGHGNFYGTTEFGGANNAGTIFEWSPTSGFTTLVSFNSTDGADPRGGLVSDGQGNFLGTTSAGGTNNLGTVFKYNATSGIKLLASFDGANGMSPTGLVPDGQGNFYGSTYFGGSTYLSTHNTGYGSIFKYSASSGITSLASFSGTQGSGPVDGLVTDGQGNFYGTTEFQGADLPYDPQQGGTIFRWNASAGITILASFTGLNGANVQSGLITDGQGNFYGTTWWGGSTAMGLGQSGLGEVYRWNASSGITVLASFTGTNGACPMCKVVADGQGNFFGATVWGGTSWNFTPPNENEANGTLFELSPTVAEGAVRSKSVVTRSPLKR